jgi:acyl dehydratase
MPLYPGMDGATVVQPAAAVDDRWVMSYAAGVGDTHPQYYETDRRARVVAHPCFYWALSWPMLQKGLPSLFSKPVLPEEKGKAVHYGEDVILHRAIRSGMSVTVSSKLVDARARKKGTIVVSKHDMIDVHSGVLLLTHWTTSFYRGVELGARVPVLKARQNELPPPVPRSNAASSKTIVAWWTIPIAENEAHVYTECSRIWNPIHTNKRVAINAGLPGTVLHGTAFLAKAASAIMTHYGPNSGDPSFVSRISVGAFATNVFMPSTLTLRIFSVAKNMAGTVVHWDLITEQNQFAVRDGVVCFRPGHPQTSKI